MMTKLLQKETIKFKCPHCKHEMSEAWICEMDSVIGLRFAYICSNCEKLLAISKKPVFIPYQLNQIRNFTKN